ncbi:MAG: OmpH family outer membrane protein [Candidatus Eisenbacteria bacterium]
MKRRARGWAGWLGLALVAALAPAAEAADVKLGYIDSAKIFQEYQLAKDAQASFDRQVQGWRSEAAEKQKAVDVLRAEVRDQGPILSALKRQEREEALQRAISEYEKFIQDIWGPQGRASQENERTTQEIVTQIRSAVEKIAADRQLDLVLDAASGFIIYADRNLDLTAVVLAELVARTTGSSPR